ncbi:MULTISPECIES: RloB family protein [unclassified Actinomyces]|uniref:RloB family protein n=1 Tax=unclassified Actinomyces TaxID=2609248 RepID=UPI000D59356C|nr:MULTISPECIES: RloB family protein [unclassified Actinomyces]RAX24485.1 RloB domain-containing protein [Actinomyces sp. Z3]
MSARDRSKGQDLRRRGVAGTPRRPVVHIFVEGSVTEKEYIERLQDVSEVTGNTFLKVHHRGNSPRRVVDAVIQERATSPDADVHQFWAVFDVEAPTPHGDLDKAMELARHHQVHTAVSNPCFELWLLLHTTDQYAYLTSAEATRLYRETDGSTDKHLTAIAPVNAEGVSRACKRSARLRERHKRNGTVFPQDNPSTTMDLLIDAIRKVGNQD